MADDLRDFRCRLTAESALMLEAVSKASGRDMAEIAREIVHGWYLDRLKEHEIIMRLFRGRGEGADSASNPDDSNSNAGARRSPL